MNKFKEFKRISKIYYSRSMVYFILAGGFIIFFVSIILSLMLKVGEDFNPFGIIMMISLYFMLISNSVVDNKTNINALLRSLPVDDNSLIYARYSLVFKALLATMIFMSLILRKNIDLILKLSILAFIANLIYINFSYVFGKKAFVVTVFGLIVLSYLPIVTIDLNIIKDTSVLIFILLGVLTSILSIFISIKTHKKELL